jgi:hypothetical protein
MASVRSKRFWYVRSLTHTYTYDNCALSHTHLTYAYDNDGDGRAKKPMNTNLFATCPLLNTLLPNFYIHFTTGQ